MKHLLFCDGKGALIDINPREISSGDYGQLYDAFKEQSGQRSIYSPQIVKLDPSESHCGVYWDWELAGPNGASYRLHVLPDVDRESVEKAKAYVRRSFDVVRLEVNRISALIDFKLPDFKHEIIRL